MKLRYAVAMALVSVLLLSCQGKKGTEPMPVKDTVEEEPAILPRSSITFIMGEDNSVYNQYYTLANYYYRLSPEERTEVVVDNLTALSQVLEYLQEHPAEDGRPYGLINVVSHGNEFIDLQMKVTPRGQRTSVAALREALKKGRLTPPDSLVVDSATVVFLHGCAVGNNQELLDLLAEAFGGGGVTVKASKLFEYYAYLSQNKNPQSVRHYYAQTWYAFYHPDSTVDENDFVRQLSRRYPKAGVNWREGLRRRFQDDPSQLYHFSFMVPCLWEEMYGSPSELPSVNSRQKRKEWVDSHPRFRKMLSQTHIPQEYFQVKFYKQAYQLDNDSIAMGFRVKARAGVVCLIRPLTVTDTTGCPYMPYLPADTDTSIFAFARAE